MDFHDIRFPTSLSFGAVGGPERRTEIVTLTNGHEERNTPWQHSRRRYDAGTGLQTLDDIEELISFFEARGGQMAGFRWKDWSDHKSCMPSKVPDFEDQVIGTGDGETTSFQLIKTYVSGAHSYVRPIKKPVLGKVSLGLAGERQVEGTHYSVDTTVGLVTFSDAPMAGTLVSAGFEFDVPVRFDTDRIQSSMSRFRAGEVPDVPVIEVRV
ncbi:phage distal tail protein, Rcc01695 family [Algirhabdus cladophorae]|uniref:phage distal tail protein, Rcc01695 family n=1 Tax=Algirhabdus cladophorae TaxID=3377108 RepID=UPI003B846203